MTRKILLPFALSTITILMQGCGGESAKINENPSQGSGITTSTSCNVNNDDCLQFVLDYPVAGLNFDCSSDIVNHFATNLDGNVVTGACKLGDNVSFYIQGEDAKKISLGTVKLNDISKLKLATPPRLRLIDIATGITGKSPVTLNQSDETIRVAMALVKVFQVIGLEQDHNVLGDIQPTELTTEKKAELSKLVSDITGQDFINGDYVEKLKPWLDVTPVSDEQAFALVVQLLNLANTGIWQADLPIAKAGGESSSTTTDGVRPDGFFGCNKETSAECIKNSTNLLHSMGSVYLLSDRQGYLLGYGQQWRGAATITNDLVIAPYVLTTKVKPQKIQLNAQGNWFNPLTQSINTENPLRFSSTANTAEDLVLKQGKLANGTTIAGTAELYKTLAKLEEKDTVDVANLGLWQQSIDGQNYKGSIDIVRANPSSYLAKDIFRTEKNVESGQNYVFPLYATLNFKFGDTTVTPKEINVGIVIDENGDIRTDIKKDATETDKTGICGTVKSLNADGTITDSNDQKQYRIGTTGATLFSANDKSISVRMILSNPVFGLVDGAMFGLNLSAGTGAKINVHNLLSGQATGINLTDFSNNTVTWSNTYAYYHYVYANNIYDKLKDEDKKKYVQPTDAEREFAKRYTGTVSIKIADQNIAACNAIKVKA